MTTTMFNWHPPSVQQRLREQKKEPLLWYGFGRHIFEQLKGLQQAQFSPNVAVIGKRRVGKSAFSSVLCNWMDKNFINAENPYIDHPNIHEIPPYRVLYQTKLIFLLFDVIELRTAIMADEFAQIANSQEWWDDLAKAFSDLTETQGYLEAIFVANMPSFPRAINRFRDVTDCVFKVLRRGTVKCYKIKPTGFGKIYLKTLGFIYNVPAPEKVMPDFWGLPVCRNCHRKLTTPRRTCYHCGFNENTWKDPEDFPEGTYQWKKRKYNKWLRLQKIEQIATLDLEGHRDKYEPPRETETATVEPEQEELDARQKKLPHIQFEQTHGGEPIPVDDSMSEPETLED